MSCTDHPDFYSPSAGFDRPLVLLQASHERVRRMVELLVRMVGHLDEFGCDERAAVSAASIRSYFRVSWPRHFLDEELDLFPRVRARLGKRPGGSGALLVEAIEMLIGQHRSVLPLWQQIEPTLFALQQGGVARLDAAAVHGFAAAYRNHLEIEEDVLGPAYLRWLTAEDLQQIGASMAIRRGVPWPPATPQTGS